MSIFKNNFNNNPTFSIFTQLYEKCPAGMTGPSQPKKQTDCNMNAWICNEPFIIPQIQNYDSLSLENDLPLSNGIKLDTVGDSQRLYIIPIIKQFNF